jgi:phosphatidylserine decarboxylase
MFLRRGCPKSLYLPGSSTDILIFQKDRILFSDDLVCNLRRGDIRSRFSWAFGQPLAETDVKVRSLIARAKK